MKRLVATKTSKSTFLFISRILTLWLIAHPFLPEETDAFVPASPYHFSVNRASVSRSTLTAMTATVNDATKEDFRGKNVLLTGASGGLGRSLALQLAACSVKTMILTARREDALAKVAHECRSVDESIDVKILTCDLADPASVRKLAENALKICPVIDVLINNGGVSSRSRFVDTAAEVDARIMQINFLSGAALAKAVVPAMEASGGRIVWISSVQGLVGIPNRSSYAASKFAVQGYCESIRAELKSGGISVHAVSPGYIRTDLSKSAVTGDGTAHGETDAATAAGADPDDVAAAVLDRVVSGRVDFTVAATFPAVAAIYMRLLCPGLLRHLLVKRYEKSIKEKSD
jgi:dehydrogenase/reductase SDR family protein 7B